MPNSSQQRSWLAAVAVVLLLAVASCAPTAQGTLPSPSTTPSTTQSGAPATPPQPTAQSVAAPTYPPGSLGNRQSASLVVRLSSTPNPPVRGVTALEAIVTDAQGQPVNDATVSFDIDMTNMSHGKNIVAAAPQGNGRYVGQARFMMPGPWRAITVVQRPGQPAEQVRFDFNVNMR